MAQTSLSQASEPKEIHELLSHVLDVQSLPAVQGNPKQLKQSQIIVDTLLSRIDTKHVNPSSKFRIFKASILWPSSFLARKEFSLMERLRIQNALDMPLNPNERERILFDLYDDYSKAQTLSPARTSCGPVSAPPRTVMTSVYKGQERGRDTSMTGSFAVYRMPGDGDCAFHSIGVKAGPAMKTLNASLEKGDPETVEHIRNLYITDPKFAKNQKPTSSDLVNYVQGQMNTRRYWLQGETLLLIAKLLNLNVRIWQPVRSVVANSIELNAYGAPPLNNPDGKIINVLFNGIDHYNLLAPTHDPAAEAEAAQREAQLERDRKKP